MPCLPLLSSRRLPATTSAPPTPAVSLITATPGSVSTTSPIATLLSSVFVAANENRLLGTTGRTSAAAERAMRLQFVQGIKKKGMTDFEMSMIQESRKGGRSPGRRR